MTDRLYRRARLIRERELIRGWEYRQRDHAIGVWYRFRRVLVDAAEAWVIDDRDADRLAALGRAALPVGAELQPPKRIFVVTAEELAGAAAGRPLPTPEEVAACQLPRRGKELGSTRKSTASECAAEPGADPRAVVLVSVKRMWS